MFVDEEDVPPVLPLVISPAPEARVPTRILYSEEVAERILEQYVGGESLMAISRLPEMPAYATLLRWCRDNEGFKKRVKAARELRAIHFEEKAILAAESVADKDDVSRARLEFDANKWAAEVNDGATYGKRTTVSGDPDKPITFIVSTGFPAPNAYQTPPELGSDGLIKKVVIVESEVVNGEGNSPSDSEVSD